MRTTALAFFFLAFLANCYSEVDQCGGSLPHSCEGDGLYAASPLSSSLLDASNAQNAALNIGNADVLESVLDGKPPTGNGSNDANSTLEEDPEFIAIHNLMQWLKKNGGEDMVSNSLVQTEILKESSEDESDLDLSLNVSKRTTRTEIGMVASRDIEMGETILTAPKKLWAGYETFEKIQNESKNTTWEFELAKWILRESQKKNESFWFPYMELLPQYVATTHYYDDFLLNLLQDDLFAEEIRNENEVVRRRYALMKLEEIEEDLQNVSFDEFKWAYTIVYSRSFSVNKVATFIPLADLFNHEGQPNCDWQVYEDNFTFSASEAIPKGTPITISYNRRDNGHFLSSYGFVPQPNLANAVTLFSTMDEIVDYFSDQVGRSALFTLRHDWNLVVANNAKIYMEELLENSTSKVDVDGYFVSDLPHFRYSALPNSQVDPRLVAIFSALWHFYIHGSELNYELLANHSLIYGRNIDGKNCSELSEEIQASIQRGVDLLHWRISSMLSNSNTTLEADRVTLEILDECKAYKSLSENIIGACKPHVIAYKNEIMNAIRYRIARKTILKNLKQRFEDTCQIRNSW